MSVSGELVMLFVCLLPPPHHRRNIPKQNTTWKGAHSILPRMCDSLRKNFPSSIGGAMIYNSSYELQVLSQPIILKQMSRWARKIFGCVFEFAWKKPKRVDCGLDFLLDSASVWMPSAKLCSMSRINWFEFLVLVYALWKRRKKLQFDHLIAWSFLGVWCYFCSLQRRMW